MSVPTVRMPFESPLKAGPIAIRVLIADDSPLGCQLLKNAFKRSRRQFDVVASAVSSHEVMQHISRERLDVALISADLQDGPLSGLQALRQIHASASGMSVIVLFDKWQDDLILHAFRSGARGVFCRSEKKLDLLCKCILAVHEGQVWANSQQLQLLLQTLINVKAIHSSDMKGMNLLSKREAQVVGLVAEGLPNKEISLKLGISEHTISNYLLRVYNKLGISTRVELVLYVMNRPK